MANQMEKVQCVIIYITSVSSILNDFILITNCLQNLKLITKFHATTPPNSWHVHTHLENQLTEVRC